MQQLKSLVIKSHEKSLQFILYSHDFPLWPPVEISHLAPASSRVRAERGSAFISEHVSIESEEGEFYPLE